MPDRAAIVQRFGSEHVAGVMIESMRSTTEEDLRRAQAARAQGDSDAVAEVLHRIVGGLGTLGAGALVEQARALMQQVGTQGVDACGEELERFDAALRDYLVALQQD
jgi:two-component system sensor histidine kinase EvgS